MAKKYIVELSKDEKAELVSLTQKGRPGAREIKRANILLLVDSGKPDLEAAELLYTGWLTVLRTRQRYVEGRLDFALNELPRAGRLPNGWRYALLGHSWEEQAWKWKPAEVQKQPQKTHRVPAVRCTRCWVRFED
jgi:hypothetical protein